MSCAEVDTRIPAPRPMLNENRDIPTILSNLFTLFSWESGLLLYPSASIVNGVLNCDMTAAACTWQVLFTHKEEALVTYSIAYNYLVEAEDDRRNSSGCEWHPEIHVDLAQPAIRLLSGSGY